MLFNNDLWRTKISDIAVQFLWVYGDSTLLVLNGTLLNSDSALLVLEWYVLWVMIHNIDDISEEIGEQKKIVNKFIALL